MQDFSLDYSKSHLLNRTGLYFYLSHRNDKKGAKKIGQVPRQFHQVHPAAACTANQDGSHMACLLSELTSSELETLEAVLDSGEHCSSVRDIINLTQNLDCYGFYPGVSDEETLGRIYVDDLEMLDVPDQVKPYFDYEAYGRDACIHENGHFAPGGYIVKESDHFLEVYHGLQDIPKEHKVFSFPKLSIREQMAAYQEIIDGSSLEGYRQMQKKGRGDR